jgi:LemA protein
MILWILLALAAAMALYGVTIYNSLIRLKNMVDEAWSGIDVQLKKRYNLIPNLVNTVKGYAKHEREVLEGVVEKRSEGINAQGVKDQEKAETGLTAALTKLFALAENYPDLKANQNFLDLQQQLKVVEEDIERARRYYNGTVRNYNIKIESFPSNIVAGMYNHQQREFFEIPEASQRAVPEVNF